MAGIFLLNKSNIALVKRPNIKKQFSNTKCKEKAKLVMMRRISKERRGVICPSVAIDGGMSCFPLDLSPLFTAQVTLRPGLGPGRSLFCPLPVPGQLRQCSSVWHRSMGHCSVCQCSRTLPHTPQPNRGKEIQGQLLVTEMLLKPGARRAAHSTILLALPWAITLLGLRAPCPAMCTLPHHLPLLACLFPRH